MVVMKKEKKKIQNNNFVFSANTEQQKIQISFIYNKNEISGIVTVQPRICGAARSNYVYNVVAQWCQLVKLYAATTRVYMCYECALNMRHGIANVVNKLEI